MAHRASRGTASLSSAGIQRRIALLKPGKQAMAGFERMDHIKTTQAGCKWVRLKAVGSRTGNGGGRMRHKANRAQTRHFDSTHLHIGLSHSGSIMRFLSMSPHSLNICDWQLSTLIDIEGARRLLRRGARQANWPSSSSFLVGFECNQHHSPQQDEMRRILLEGQAEMHKL